MLSESLNVDAALAPRRSGPSGVRKVGPKPGGGQYASKALGKSNITQASTTFETASAKSILKIMSSKKIHIFRALMRLEHYMPPKSK